VATTETVLRFVALTAADAAEVASWFEDDPEGQRRFGGFYGVHPKWWALVQDAGRLGWTVREGDEPVGFVDMEINSREGSIAFYVVRHRRHAGLGRTLLRQFGSEARKLGVTALYGGIAPDNEASIRAALAAGARIECTNEHGELILKARLDDA